MRALQLGLGWIALCGFTAAGTYYAVIELDRQMNLQARLCPACAVAASAPSGQAAPDPRNPVRPPSTQVIPPGQQTQPQPPRQQVTIPPSRQAAPPHQQVVTPPPQQAVTPNPSPVVQPPQQQYPAPRPYQPPQQQPPVYRPPDQPAIRVDMSALVSRLNALGDRARSLNVFFSQMETTLQQQGQSMRSDLRSARSSMQQYLNDAAASIRSGNGAAASQKLDLAEEKIIFLEQSK